MSKKPDLLGKTITGVVAAPACDRGPLKIWMLQFSDGTHVEFVSPGARAGLRQFAKASNHAPNKGASEPQLALNVA